MSPPSVRALPAGLLLALMICGLTVGLGTLSHAGGPAVNHPHASHPETSRPEASQPDASRPAAIATRDVARVDGRADNRPLLTVARREPDPGTTASDPPLPSTEAKIAVEASDVVVGADYWQGTEGRYQLTVTVSNTGQTAINATTTVVLPAALILHGVSTGCVSSGLSFECAIGAGASTTISITVTITPDAWRTPTGGSVRATATAVDNTTATATAEDSFTVAFPPGPPASGMELAVGDVTLSLDANRRLTHTNLDVHLRNTGDVQAPGVVELMLPAGVEVATMPAQCVTRERVDASHERCDLGRIAVGQRVELTFGLTIRPQAAGASRGSVLGTLLPSGQDPVVVQDSYQIVVTVKESAAANSPGPVGAAAADPVVGSGGGTRRDPISAISPRLSLLPLLTAIIGLFFAVGALTALSLRDRLRDVAATAPATTSATDELATP